MMIGRERRLAPYASKFAFEFTVPSALGCYELLQEAEENEQG